MNLNSAKLERAQVRDSQIKYSFVIPCYKSEHTIVSVLDEIALVMGKDYPGVAFEVITVVDGSPDGVFLLLKGEADRREYLKVVDLTVNCGQGNAQMAGFRLACGEITVALDDDGQCPVDQLPRLLEPLNSGADMSVALYPKKKQSAFKNFGSQMNNFMGRAIIGMPDNFRMSNFFAFNAVVSNALKSYTSPDPYYLGMVFQITDRVVNVPMEERERLYGSSTYTLKKLLSLWLDGFTGFSVKPLRIADVAGAICALLGFAFGIYTLIRYILGYTTVAGYTTTIASVFFVGGILMLLLGLIGEYVGRILITINNVPQYTIREIVVHADCEKNAARE